MTSLLLNWTGGDQLEEDGSMGRLTRKHPKSIIMTAKDIDNVDLSNGSTRKHLKLQSLSWPKNYNDIVDLSNWMKVGWVNGGTAWKPLSIMRMNANPRRTMRTEMEKRTKIAQTKVLDVRNSTKNAYFAACHDSRQNSVNCHETKKLCFRTLLWQCAVRPVL